MTDYNDYQLEDAEDAAVKRSKNLKRGLAVGGAVGGLGTISAFAASKLAGGTNTESQELTEEDLISGAQAGADEAVEDAPAAEEPQTVVHEHHHIHIHTPKPEEVIEPEMEVEETAVIFDENGDIVASYDAGTYGGKRFMVMDTDGNGKADLMAYDENNNGVFEDNEISELDNESYEIGKGENLAIYEKTADGEVELVDVRPNPLRDPMAHNTLDDDDDISGIHNDFEDEKTGEVYGRDLAENNPDYNNHGDTGHYSAGMEEPEFEIEETADDYLAQTEPESGYSQDTYETPDNYDSADTYNTADAYDSAGANDTADTYDSADNYTADNTDVTDYGYHDPAEDYTSYDSSVDSFDEAASYDA